MALPPGFEAIDFETYHRDTLPGLLAAGRGRLAARAAARLQSRLALRLPEGAAFTYVPTASGIDVVAGDAAATTVIELDLEAWQSLAHELEAVAGLTYAGRLRCRRGNAVELMAWESALRAMYNGRPPYEPARLDLRDRRGAPLDRNASFGLDAERDDMAHFLRTAGYLFVRGVLRPDEVERLRAEAAALRDAARPGDKLSWWGRTSRGEEVLCRVTCGVRKPGLAGLATDARLLSLVALAEEPLVYSKGEGEGVAVIFKRPDMREGLGDLPWHRDCGVGGHASRCPLLQLSIYLREATPESGELAMLPGSHRAAFNAHDATLDPMAWAAHFAAQPGDVSLHYSDTVHAAPPPTASDRAEYRVSAVLSFGRPTARHHRGESSYNDVLHQRADGQIEHLNEVARRL
ncbi:MAG: phytanoyl-CoA dioxygenase family protein [Deltaproteobacteria bacterium]|nr:phytanoyl-CoA dioxygenase family protein [Deltaproteobacteria bacterium]